MQYLSNTNFVFIFWLGGFRLTNYIPGQGFCFSEEFPGKVSLLSPVPPGDFPPTSFLEHTVLTLTGTSLYASLNYGCDSVYWSKTSSADLSRLINIIPGT